MFILFLHFKIHLQKFLIKLLQTKIYKLHNIVCKVIVKNNQRVNLHLTW